MATMYQTRVSAVSGRIVTDDNGDTLYRIGNMPVKAGDYVWTDGAAVYGFFIDTDEPKPYVPDTGAAGIPVLAPPYFYILSQKDGSILRAWRFSGVVPELFVNDSKDAFVLLHGDDGAWYKGKWYNLKTGAALGVSNFLIIDAQVNGGALKLLSEDGLYSDLALSEAAAAGQTIANRLYDIMLAKAQGLTSSTESATAYSWIPYALRDGAINGRNGTWYLYNGNLRANGNAYLDITPTGQNSYTLGLSLRMTSVVVVIRGGSISFENIGCLGDAASVSSTGAAVYDDGQGEGSRAITAWQGQAVFGYGYNDTFSGLKRAYCAMYKNRWISLNNSSGEWERGAETVFSPQPTAQDYGGDEETALKAWADMRQHIGVDVAPNYFPDPGDKPGDYYYYYENSSSYYLNHYPLNDGYVMTRQYDVESGNTTYFLHDNGGALIASFNDANRSDYIYTLQNGDKFKVHNTIYRIRDGTATVEFYSENRRLAYMQNAMLIARNFGKLVTAQGGTWESE